MFTVRFFSGTRFDYDAEVAVRPGVVCHVDAQSTAHSLEGKYFLISGAPRARVCVHMCVCVQVSGCLCIFFCVFYVFKFSPVRVRTRAGGR